MVWRAGSNPPEVQDVRDVRTADGGTVELAGQNRE